MTQLLDDFTDTLGEETPEHDLQGYRPQESKPQPLFQVRARQAGRMALAQVTGPLDGPHAEAFLAQIRPLSESSRRVVLDLRRTDFIDSDGIRALMVLRERMEAREAELRLVLQPDSRIRRTLALLHLDRRLDLYDSAIDAWIVQRRPA